MSLKRPHSPPLPPSTTSSSATTSPPPPPKIPKKVHYVDLITHLQNTIDDYATSIFNSLRTIRDISERDIAGRAKDDERRLRVMVGIADDNDDVNDAANAASTSTSTTATTTTPKIPQQPEKTLTAEEQITSDNLTVTTCTNHILTSHSHILNTLSSIPWKDAQSQNEIKVLEGLQDDIEAIEIEIRRLIDKSKMLKGEVDGEVEKIFGDTVGVIFE